MIMIIIIINKTSSSLISVLPLDDSKSAVILGEKQDLVSYSKKIEKIEKNRKKL
jgi:hypothetical protein